MTLAHTQSKGREYETFQPTREKRRSASCRLRVVGRGQATPMIVRYVKVQCPKMNDCQIEAFVILQQELSIVKITETCLYMTPCTYVDI